jgi:hypothetical protein
LHALGDFQLLRESPLGFEFLGCGAALGLDFADKVVAAHQDERVPIQIIEARKDSAPECGLRRVMEADTSFLPFFEFRHHVFGYENGVFGTADELVVRRIALGGDQSQNRVSVGRRDRDPAADRFIVLIHNEAKPELVHVEA